MDDNAITDEVFDALAGPLAFAACLLNFAGVVEEFPVSDEVPLLVWERWPTSFREEALEGLLGELEDIRDWAQGMMDKIDEVRNAASVGREEQDVE